MYETFQNWATLKQNFATSSSEAQMNDKYFNMSYFSWSNIHPHYLNENSPSLFVSLVIAGIEHLVINSFKKVKELKHCSLVPFTHIY